MSHTELRNWLIAYDIVDPRRLKKVHRYLKSHAIPVQYSVFVFQGSQIGLERVLKGIAERIEPSGDDVRAYHLPSRCEVAMLGVQHLPEGVTVGTHGLERLLRELTANDDGSIVEDLIEAVERSDDGYLSDEQNSWQPPC